MISYDEALAAIADLGPVDAREALPLPEARGRFLAVPVALDRDQPSFDRATMDGYAVALAAGKEGFRVIGTIHAGDASSLAPAPGEAVRIMTGAACPPDVTVVPVEITDGGEDLVHVTEPAALVPGRNIAWRGEDGHAGDVIAERGQRLSPVVLSAVAMAGQREVEVFRRPRVGVVTTGDEIGGEGAAMIHDSNGPLMVSLLESMGCAVSRHHARDAEGHLRATLEAARDGTEIVVTTGGVSAGARDFVPAVATALGYEIVFHKVAMQPGKPALLCRHPDGSLLVGLPGNPVSVIATAHLILAPVLGRNLGGWQPSWVTLPIAEDWSPRGRRRLFLPARLGAGGVRPLRWNGSGDLLAAAAADGLVDLGPRGEHAVGDPVRFMPYVGSRISEYGVLPPRKARS